jgi:hypothetical protein
MAKVLPLASQRTPRTKARGNVSDVIAWDYEPATPRRPSPMLEFAYCKNVRVEGVTLTNAAGWTDLRSEGRIPGGYGL